MFGTVLIINRYTNDNTCFSLSTLKTYDFYSGFSVKEFIFILCFLKRTYSAI